MIIVAWLTFCSVFMNIWRLLKMLRGKMLLARMLNRLNDRSSGRVTLPLAFSVINSLDEYKKHKTANLNEYAHRSEVEQLLEGSKNGFYTPGYCYVCNQKVNFYSDFSFAFTDAKGHQKPNWREHLLCPSCRLNNRMRAAIHIFEQTCKPQPNDAIYLTEQITPLFHWFSHNYRNVIGSEYLGNKVPFGQLNEKGLRNETLTGLTLIDN